MGEASLALSVLAVCLAVCALLTRRRIHAPVGEGAGHPVHDALAELHERSKPSGGRLHLHDVEEVLRRRLG